MIDKKMYATDKEIKIMHSSLVSIGVFNKLKSYDSLMAMGFYEEQSLIFKKDKYGEDSNEIDYIYIFFGSYAKASDTLNSISRNYKKNSIWFFGRNIKYNNSVELNNAKKDASESFYLNFKNNAKRLNTLISNYSNI